MVILYILGAVILIYGLYEFVFWVTHREPLTNEEIELLADRRRIREINFYYSFFSGEMNVDKNFKSRMNANGKIYRMDESLNKFPAIAAALLKYKKHEWLIVAFERSKRIEYIWVNKGFNSSNVTLFWPHNDIAKFCVDNDISTALMFHNHPNSNPNYYNCTQASHTDIISAESFSRILQEQGINLIEFVCERGNHYRYYYNYVDSFKARVEYIPEIMICNGVDKKGNYSLHKEIRRTSGIRFT